MALRADDVDLGRDRSLVEQFQAGDAAAFDDLYRRYFQRLYRFCLKRVGDTHEAEELAQEAFTRAYLNLDNLGGDRRFYPWVTVIAGRLCVDTHRRRARSQPSDEVDPGVVDGGQEAILNEADITLLNQAISRLATRHQEVLDLRERQGFSYQRISEYYGVSLGTVEALLWRARKALRREFLALTNGEAPALAGAPLGVGMSRLASWRMRVGIWLGNRGQPFVAGAAALATATAVGLTGAGGNTAIAAAPAAASRVRAAGSSDLTSTSAATAASLVQQTSLAPTVAGVTSNAKTAIHTLTANQQIAAEFTRLPIKASNGTFGIGLDPPKIVPTVVANVQQAVSGTVSALSFKGGQK